MRKLLALLAIAYLCLYAQELFAQNPEGQIIASQYQYRIVGFSPNTYSWPGGTCNDSGPQKQFAFAVGAPVTIVDGSPALTENVTPTAVLNNNQNCAISIAAVNNHQLPFYVQSATGGLQEAINLNLATPATNTIILNSAWYQSVGSANATAVIATAKGSAQLNLVDITTTPYNWYAWNGSQYVLTTIAGQSLATYNVPGLQGGGRCFVYPSQITTDAFALINNCTAQLPAKGGLIDATALGSANYTVTTQLTALNSANQAVELLLNPATTFTINTSFPTPANSPAFCAVPVGPASQPNGGSSIIVPGKNAFAGSNFVLGPSAKVWDVICNGDFTGNQESLKLDGVYVQGNQSATMSGALIHLSGVFTPTSIINSGTMTPFGQAVELDAGTTGSGGPAIGDLLFENDLFQDTYSGSAVYPGSVVNINTINGLSAASNMTWIGGMIQANGPHNPLLTINGHGGVQADSFGFIGTTFQGAPATTSSFNSNVDPIQLTDVSSVLITNLRFAGNTLIASQPNLVDVNGTAQNTSYGINLNQIVAYTGNFTCLVKNNVEGTCESGYPNGTGTVSIPPYQYGQFFPQIRQTNVAPPTTPGMCVAGSIWTNSSATTAAQAILVCAGTPGSQVYVSLGGGGGGGGGLGTLQNDLVGNKADNSGAIDLLNFFSSSTFTEQQAINAAYTSVGVATLMPKAIPVPFTNFNDASVVDLEHPAARAHSATEWGAQCNTRPVQISFTSGSNIVTITNGFFTTADIGKDLPAVGLVGGLQTAWEPKVTAMGSGSGPGYATAVMDTNAPFNQAAVTYEQLGFDDTAGLTTAFAKALADGYALQFPSSSCLSHNITYNGISFYGLSARNSQWGGFPGENILTAPDPSTGSLAPGNGVHIHDIVADVDMRINATQPWQIINAAGTTAKTAVYQPTGILSGVANNPLGAGWMQGSGPNFSGAYNGVANVAASSAVICTTSSKVPAVGNTIVFPYLSSVFTTTVASTAGSCGTGTARTLTAAMPSGSTNAQAEWFAGTSVQTLGGSYSGTGCPATMTLTNPITPSPNGESNVAPFGLVQVDGEQFTYFGATGPATPSTYFLAITGCAQNGTSRSAHSSGATIVPLNPFKPATPWPVTPTVNTGFTTPLLAAYYPAWNVGNGFFEAPVANGATGTFGVDSFANATINNIVINSYPSNISANNTTPFYFVSLPYSTRFHDIVVQGTYFGPEEGLPAFNSGAGWAAAQPTADGSSWEGIRISACNVMNMIAGNQNTYKDFNVYSQCQTPAGATLGANTSWYFTAGWNDQTGTPLSFVSKSHLINMYTENEFGTQYGSMPILEADCIDCLWDDQHMGSGGAYLVGGSGQHWRGGNFNQQYNFPLIDYGVGNGSENTNKLGEGFIGNVYGTNQLIEYGQNASWVGQINQPNGTATGPYGPNGLFGREPIPNQTAETFNYGNTTVPFVSSDGGIITANEFNSVLTSYEAQAFQVPPYSDATSFSGWSVGCNVGTVGVGCLSYKFNQDGVYVGPGERIAAGKNTMYIQSKSTGTASSYQLQLGVGTPDNVGNYTIPVTSSYTWTKVKNIDFTGLGGGGAGIALGFANASSADTITVGAVAFVPVWQEPAVNNLDVFNQLIDSTGSAGTTGYVWSSQGSGSPNHWAASSGGITGGTTNQLPVYSSATTLIPSLFADNGTTGSYTGTGGFSVITTTPGKMSLIAGSGSIPALAANSAGFAAPNTGGTAYLFKPPATVTQGFLFAATPATNDGVNESALTTKSIEFILDGDTSTYGFYASGTLIKSAKMSNAGHFTNLEVGNISTASCTGAPTINVYDLTASTSGTGLVASNTGTPSGTILDQAQTLAFSAGDQIAIKVQTIGSSCASSEFEVSATVSEP